MLKLNGGIELELNWKQKSDSYVQIESQRLITRCVPCLKTKGKLKPRAKRECPNWHWCGGRDDRKTKRQSGFNIEISSSTILAETAEQQQTNHKLQTGAIMSAEKSDGLQISLICKWFSCERLALDFIVRFILKCLADEQEFLRQPSNFVFPRNLQRPHVLPAAAQERTAFILIQFIFCWIFAQSD